MKSKVCTKCKERKFVTLFGNNKKYNDGLNYWCKKCCSSYSRKRSATIKRRIELVKSKLCPVCKQTKSAKQFVRNSSIKDGLDWRCKKCSKKTRDKIKNNLKINIFIKTKQCSKCKKRKVISKFYLNCGNKNGLTNWCKSCYKEAHYKLKLFTKTIPKKKKCSRCKKIKTAKKFYFNQLNKDGLDTICKICISKRGKLYKKNNPEKIKLNHRRRKAKKRGAEGSFTEEEFVRICEAQDWKCTYCKTCLSIDGEKKRTKKATRDHIIPLIRGGSDYIENIQAVCLSCNSSKNSKTHEEFLNWLTKNQISGSSEVP